ncbi:MAG: hypothetical protein ACQCN4_11415 [Candidatus Bathyarchaeia archaeon]|jgi:hypothetical protein
MSKTSQQIQKTLEECKPGDLICVDWCDASCGKSSQNGGNIDVPVRSWGVYLGLMGTRIKQIVLAQNSFRFNNALYDLDYTAIPISWATEILCIQADHIPQYVVDDLLRSFVNDNAQKSTGGLRSARIFHHKIQRKLSVNGGPD